MMCGCCLCCLVSCLLELLYLKACFFGIVGYRSSDGKGIYYANTPRSISDSFLVKQIVAPGCLRLPCMFLYVNNECSQGRINGIVGGGDCSQRNNSQSRFY